jgi:hypothetical protein
MALKAKHSGEHLKEAIAAWRDNRASMRGGGNYWVSDFPSTPTHHQKQRIAPWNRAVKAYLRATGGTLHDLAYPD